MSISGPFIRRPVATTLLSLAIVVFGVIGYRALPVSDLPNVDFPTILVSAALPGASPETMAAAVATPLERQFSTIAGIDSMTSTSSLGSTQITLQFDIDRDVDGAAQDVQAAIAAAGRSLPPEMPAPPTYFKVNPAANPVLYIALTSPTLPLWKLDEYGETLMAQRISMVSGVAQVQVFGAQKYALRVQVSPQALEERNIAIDDVARAVQDANVNLPGGVLSGPRLAFTIQATGQVENAAQLRPVVVAYRDGAWVRLDEVARVVDSVENTRAAAFYVSAGPRGVEQRSVVLAVQRQPGTNTIAVAKAILALLPQLEERLPASVTAHLLFDRSASIQSSVNDVELTLLITLALVILVIFAFLRSARATLIPSMALPLSVLATFGVLWSLGYSLDNLSLMGLTLSVGFIIDDAIVMLENIVRHMESGEDRRTAALDGAREIGFTIVSMTLSLSAVFIPVLFMGGLLGRLFREFGVTIAVAILVSGMVSLTLTPMLASRFLSTREHDAARRPGALSRGAERAFFAAQNLYARALRWALLHVKLVLGFSALVLVATGGLFVLVPKGLLPPEDTGQLFASTEAAENISFDDMVRHQQQVAEVIRREPGVEAFMSAVGVRAGAVNSGMVFVRLEPRNKRDDAGVILERLRKKLARIPGIKVFLQEPGTIPLGGRLTKSQYQLTLSGGDTRALYKAAAALEDKMHAVALLQDVTSDLQVKSPQVRVVLDRDRASSLGVSAMAVETALFDAFASRQVSTIYAPDNTYSIILEVVPEAQEDPRALSLLRVKSNSGALVPLDEVADLHTTAAPLAVNHSGQLPSVTLSFNLAPGASLGPAVSAVQDLANKTVPAGVTTSFQGAAQVFQSSLSGLGWLLVLTVVVIYIVLGVLYESFRHPVTILTALPFAGFGALLTLLLFGADLSLYAFVGIVMLVGLVKKNGIMMVDFALDAQKQGKPPNEAIFEASIIRFRPIMMTTMAALVGTLPIAIGFGTGAEMRRPLGLAVVGGLLFSQLFTLVVTPVFFLWISGRGRHSAAGPSMPS